MKALQKNRAKGRKKQVRVRQSINKNAARRALSRLQEVKQRVEEVAIPTDLHDAVGENEARGFIGLQYLVLQKPEPETINNGKLTWNRDLVKLIVLQANVVSARGDRWVKKIFDRALMEQRGALGIHRPRHYQAAEVHRCDHLREGMRRVIRRQPNGPPEQFASPEGSAEHATDASEAKVKDAARMAAPPGYGASHVGASRVACS